MVLEHLFCLIDVRRSNVTIGQTFSRRVEGNDNIEKDISSAVKGVRNQKYKIGRMKCLMRESKKEKRYQSSRGAVCPKIVWQHLSAAAARNPLVKGEGIVCLMLRLLLL
jgi:hypothetical protein